MKIYNRNNKYNPEIHHRYSSRSQGYDYSQNGAYFITLCTEDRKPLFGKIINGEMQLSQFGIIARDEWQKTSEMRKNIEMDEFVVMPNHFHGIIIINDLPCTGTLQRAPTREQFGKPTSNSIPTIIRGYKAAVTKRINTIRINTGAYNMPERIWQRNYYEHVIRNEASLHRIREYIMGNPLNWKDDDYYLA